MARSRSVGVKVGVGANIMAMTGGAIGGLVVDAIYGMMGLPGYNQPIANCSIITTGDAMQLLAYAGFTLVGLLFNSVVVPAFTSGLLVGKIIPVLIMPAFNLPRYGIIDFDPQTGSLTPGFRAPELNLPDQIAPPIPTGEAAYGIDYARAMPPQPIIPRRGQLRTRPMGRTNRVYTGRYRTLITD